MYVWDIATSSYYPYATSSYGTPMASGPTESANHANFNNVVGHPTDVGAYTGTKSPYGAFDMNGNLFQWNEALINRFFRGTRGCAFDLTSNAFFSSNRNYDDPEHTAQDNKGYLGFRVATVTTAASFAGGDFNRDGHVNVADIPTMLAALTDLNAYKANKGLTDGQLLSIGDVDDRGA